MHLILAANLTLTGSPSDHVRPVERGTHPCVATEAFTERKLTAGPAVPSLPSTARID
jgi:hypothetical protein